MGEREKKEFESGNKKIRLKLKLGGEIMACAMCKMKSMLALYEKMYDKLSSSRGNGITNNNKEKRKNQNQKCIGKKWNSTFSLCVYVCVCVFFLKFQFA